MRKNFRPSWGGSLALLDRHAMARDTVTLVVDKGAAALANTLELEQAGLEVANLDWRGRGYSDERLKVLAPNAQEYQKLLEALKTIGIKFIEKSRLRNPFEQGQGSDTQFEVQIEGIIDHAIKRAFLKILVNFAAKYIGCDEVIKKERGKCRDYVRWNGEPIRTRVSTKPFWAEESQNLRFDDDS